MEKLDGRPGMQVTRSCVCSGNQATQQVAPGGPRWPQVSQEPRGKGLVLEAQDRNGQEGIRRRIKTGRGDIPEAAAASRGIPGSAEGRETSGNEGEGKDDSLKRDGFKRGNLGCILGRNCSL